MYQNENGNNLNVDQKNFKSRKKISESDGRLSEEDQIDIFAEIIIDYLLKDNYEKESIFNDESNGTAT